MQKSFIIKKQYIILIICSILLFLVNLIYLNQIYTIVILDDEYGYWSNAAYFAGYNWSESLKEVAYYSYGQGIVLSIFMRIFEKPVFIYRAAVVYNAFLVSMMFLLIYTVISKFFSELPFWTLLLLAGLGVFLPVVVSNVNLSWPEIAIQFWFWMAIFCVLKIEENKSTKKQILYICSFGVIVVYLYMLHQRTIGIIMASCIVMLVFYATKKVRLSSAFLFFAILFVFLFCTFLLKNHIQSNLWIYLSDNNINDYGGQLKKIISLTTIDGMSRFFHVMIGHLLYIGISSFLFAYFAFLYFVREIVSFVKKKQENHEIYSVSKIFLVFCFLFMLGISSLFMSNPNRIDHVVYGRYFEFTAMPLFVSGIALFLTEKEKKRTVYFYIASILFFIFSIFITGSYLNQKELQPLNLPNVPSLNMFPPFGRNTIFDIIFSFLVLGGIIVIFTFFFILNLKGNKKKIYSYSLMYLIIVIVLLNGHAGIHRIILSNQKENRKYNILADKIPDSEKPIYYKLTKEWNKNKLKDFFQFALKDKQLIACYPEEIPQKEGSYVISVQSDPFEASPGIHYQLKMAQDFFRLWEYHSDYDSRSEEGSMEYLFSLQEFSSENRDKTKKEFVSNGQEGYLTYGPYIELGKGNYTLTIQTTIKDRIEKEFGWIEIIGKNGSLQKVSLEESDIINNKIISQLNFSLLESENSVEIRFMLKKGSIVELDHVILKKNSFSSK